ncbi:MAG TPA: aldo/keto reductase [Gemmatimonas sp.]|uniref:aldo/keto reductase n=1 Tax=Gemmatimonas sp. TaxID=1962908 RepID=UPI002ED79B9D
MTAIPDVRLNDGTTLPAIGLGTYGLRGAAGVQSMIQAVQNGYRLLDSAVNYENEGAVGAAVRRVTRELGIPRDALRITSKLPGRHHRQAAALLSIEESLFRTQLDYFDLYIIHWPNPRQELYVEAWQALVEAQKRGLVRSIGVSNFLPEHLDRIIADSGVVPSVNQVELHPYLPQDEQRAYHAKHGIVTESWSPIARGKELLAEPVLEAIATRVQRTVSQVVLRWHAQVGAIAIPKSASSERQQENLALFDFTLTDADMASIATLARENGRIFGFHPADHEEF